MLFIKDTIKSDTFPVTLSYQETQRRFTMNIKCIALDLDRTTLNAKGKLSSGNYHALSEAIQKGVHIVIASGRSFDTLPKDVLAVPGIEYAITSNGAAVYYIPEKKCIHEYKMKSSSIKQILKVTQNYPVALEVFINGTAYALKAYVEDPVSYGTTSAAIPYIQSTRNPVEDIVTFIKEHIDEIDSMAIVVSGNDQKQEIWEKLEKNCDEIYITSSVSQLIEISHKDAGKHSGLRFIREYLNLHPEETAAFGDGDNDVDLLKEAGVGIAMENASPKCKEAASYITKHHDKDGVAYGIQNILNIL